MDERLGHKANDGGRRRNERGGIARTTRSSRIASPVRRHTGVEIFKFASPNGANYSTHPAE